MMKNIARVRDIFGIRSRFSGNSHVATNKFVATWCFHLDPAGYSSFQSGEQMSTAAGRRRDAAGWLIVLNLCVPADSCGGWSFSSFKRNYAVSLLWFQNFDHLTDLVSKLPSVSMQRIEL